MNSAPSSSRSGGGWLTRNLVVLSGVSFLQDAASELLYPILPIFLTVTLGAPAAVVGVVEGLAEGAASATKLTSGLLGDRFAKRPLIGLGYGLAALGKLLVAVASTWPLVLAGRVIDRLGKGVRGAPRDGLIAQGIPERTRGRAFGFHRASDTAGAVVGPLLGLLGYELLHHRIRPLLTLALAPAVLSVLLVFAVRESGSTRKPARSIRLVSGAGALPPSYWRTVGLLTMFSLANFPDALLLLRLHDIGFSVEALILAYVGYNVVYAVASYPAGLLGDRLPRPAVFGVGLLFFAAGYLGLGLTRQHTLAWLVLALYGLFSAFTDGVGKAWISSLAPPERQASAQGIFQSLTGLGVLLAGVWAGFAWASDGHVPLLISGAAGTVIAALLLAVAVPRNRQPPNADRRIGSRPAEKGVRRRPSASSCWAGVIAGGPAILQAGAGPSGHVASAILGYWYLCPRWRRWTGTSASRPGRCHARNLSPRRQAALRADVDRLRDRRLYLEMYPPPPGAHRESGAGWS